MGPPHGESFTLLQHRGGHDDHVEQSVVRTICGPRFKGVFDLSPDFHSFLVEDLGPIYRNWGVFRRGGWKQVGPAFASEEVQKRVDVRAEESGGEGDNEDGFGCPVFREIVGVPFFATWWAGGVFIV